MGQIDSGSKSSRLLASRRYTHNTLTSAQEAFTNVLDLRAEEIYTRAHLIPSSSLPHSGSSQKMAEFTKEGQTVTKYWYRHALTKSNTNNEVWFFLSPTGSNSGIGAQLIDSNQQTNFISPKYAIASLATSTTADSTPGYLAAVYKSTSTDSSSLDGDDIVSTNDYQFDYKTGVLQFKSSTVDPTDSQYLYMTAYQYVGQTLKTGLEILGPFTASNVTITGDSDITSFASTAQSMISGSWKGELSSSLVKVAGGGVSGSSTSTGSFAHVFVGDRLVFKDHQDSGEYISSDGTDISINVGSGGDINIPSDIGVTFGNDGEKIEGDGTDLTIAGNNINLTAVADVNIPSGVGLTFATTEKIESDGTDLSITVGSSGDINIPADIGLTFGDDGEKIEGDGTDLTITGNIINLSPTADVAIPVNKGLLFAGTEKLESDGTDLTITVGAGGDINVGSGIGVTFGDDGEKIEGDGTDLTIASSNDLHLTATTDINVPSGVGLTFGDDGEKIEGNGTDLTIASSNDLNLTATTDINIPSEVGLTFGNDGEKIEGDGTDLTIASSGILTLSSTGNTIIETVTIENGNVTIPGDLTVTGDRFEAQVGSLQVADHTITVGSGSATSALMEAGGLDFGISGSVANLRYQHATTSLTSSAFLVAPKLTVDTITVDGSEIDASGALTIDTGGDLSLDATGDINIPSAIGLTFGDDGEKIEGDGTDLTIASSNELNLSATTDVVIPVDVGLHFGDGNEKIESNNTDLTLNSGVDINLTATTDINIPADVGLTFGNDAEKIEGDGTDLTITGNIINLSPTADVAIPVNKGITFGTHEKIESDDTDLTITVGSGGDINIGSGIGLTFGDDGEKIEGDGTDLTIASSNDLHLTATTDINIPSAVGLTFGNDGEKIEGDGTHLTIATSDKLKLDVATDLEIDVDGGDIKITDDGAHVADISATAISGSSVSTGSFAYVNVTSKVSGSSVSTGSFGRLEILGDADIDGTLETDALTIDGTTLSETIADTVGAMVGSNTETGIAVTYVDGDNTLDFVLDAAQTTITSIYATDLKMGEDSDTAIDFGTTNQVRFAAGGQVQLRIADGVFTPLSDSDVDLGTSSQYFKDAYIDSVTTTGNVSGSSVSTGSFGRLELAGNASIDGDITLGGSITIGDADSDDISIGGEFTSHLVPNADATYDLGSSTKGWNDLHLGSGGVINLDGGDVTLTHSANTITVAGGTLAAAAITGTTIDASTDFTIGSTVITDDSIVMTPSTSDTATISAATNGALSITTVDDAAAAANITITADGTFEAIGTTVTLDSGGAINLEPAAGSAILLDGTISVDAGVVTGATSITSTALSGELTGNSSTATALATARTIAMTGDVAWTSPSFDGSGNVTAAGTIQANAVQTGMVHDDVATELAGAGTTATSGVINVIGGNGITANANDIAVTAAQTTITSIYATDLIMGEDSTTSIDFGTPDAITISAGGEKMILAVEGSGGDQADKVTINEDAADIDFQVKGDTDANLFRTDAANDRVGIGILTPTVKLEVHGDLYVTGSISGSSTTTGSFGRIETGRISGSSINLTADVSASNVYVSDSSGLYTDKIRRYSDSDNTTKILLNDEVLKFHAGHSSTESFRISGGAGATISGSSTSTGSFGRVEATNYAGDGSGLTGVVDDSSLAFAIVFGG